MVSISLVVTGIYDSRWRASSRSRYPVNGRKFRDCSLSLAIGVAVRNVVVIEIRLSSAKG